MGIYFLRHGQTEANVSEQYSGLTNTNLTEFGRKQAEDAGKQLKDKDIKIIYTSQLQRTIDTADIVAEQLGNNPKRIVSEMLNERNFGIFEGMYYNEVHSRFGVSFDSVIRDVNYRPVNGERLLDVYARVVMYHNNELSYYSEIKDNILIVSHYAPIACLLTHHNKYDTNMIPTFSIDNCQVFNI